MIDLRPDVAAPSDVSVVVIGRAGVTREVVAHTLRSSGRDIVDLAGLEDDPDRRVVAVVVNPAEPDWQQVDALGADAIAVLETDDEAEVIDVMLRGADAMITTSSDPDDLVRAIDIVAGGGSVLEPAIARTVLQQLRKVVSERPALTLTPREMDILLSIEQGESIKQTARSLGISVKTVQNVQSRLFNKLRARNRAQAVSRAHELGLLRTIWLP